MRRIVLAASLAAVMFAGAAAAQEWEPAEAELLTPWAEDVSPEAPLPEYPRPQLARDAWKNLNGLWEYALTGRNEDRPEAFDGQILVPYPIQSALSGVGEEVDEHDRLWYRRSFEVPEDWDSDRVRLNFGAIDWEAQVWVNGRFVGEHRGGYDPFSFDITSALHPEGPQDLTIAVWDPADDGYQPRGKQVQNPGGIWYSAVSGIWQTVWLEPVADQYVEDLRITPDIDASTVRIDTTLASHADAEVAVTVLDGDESVAEGTVSAHGRSAIKFDVPDARLWSPDSPHLYDVEIDVVQDGAVVDEVESYFGMRKISLGEDENGRMRIKLNNEFVFQYGFLDQGWWPDGLYTAPTDEALRYDIEMTKEMGFNMARKHVKVEPARWYYWADQLGLLVWQDMPNGDEHIGPQDPDIDRVAQSSRQFDREYLAMIDAYYNHPSIVMWVPFNEGWGQFDTERVVDLTKEHDPTRLVNNASGWTDRGVGDVHDIHAYPGPGAPEAEEDRAIVLGEFGGPGLMIEDHVWQEEDVWGHHQTFETKEDLQEGYEELIRDLLPLIGEPGLSAAVFTQTTDVEVEVNGLMTYDRRVNKLEPEWLREIHAPLYEDPPTVETLVPDSREEARTWRYTFEEPAEGWEQPGFDDGQWEEGPGGFGIEGTPEAVVRTEWPTSSIWLRRAVTLDEDLLDRDGELALHIHHDEDAEVYINGELVAEFEDHVTQYKTVILDSAAREALEPGENVIAVHCLDNEGGRYIDVGLALLEK